MEKYKAKLKQITKLKPKIKPKTLISLLTFVAIISTLSYVGYRILRDGIYAQHFSIAGINVDGLYLKLENKLILDIQKLDLSHAFEYSQESTQQSHQESNDEESLTQEDTQPQQTLESSEPVSIDSIVGYIKDGLLVFSYFETLNVHNIILPDKQARKILYDGHLYQVYDPNFEAILNTTNDNGKIKLEIETLNIYPLNIQLDGNVEYVKKTFFFDILATYEKDLQSLRVLKPQPNAQQSAPQQENTQQNQQEDSNIIFAPPPHLLAPPPPHAQVQRSQYQDIHNATKPTFSIIGNTNFKKIDVEVKSSKLNSIHFLQQYLKPLNNNALEEWLFNRITFESVQIDTFTLNGKLNDKFLDNLSKQMRAKATIKNAKVAVAPKVEPIKADNAHLALEDGYLNIALDEPTFDAYSIKDSSVGIKLPFHNPVEVFVKICSTKIGVEQPLVDLLKFYGIDIPLQTDKSILSAGIDLHLRVVNHIVQPQLVKGTISGSDVKLLFLGEGIFAKDLGVKISITPDEQNVAVVSSHLNYNDIVSTSLLLNIYPLQGKIEGTLKPEKIDIDINKIAQKPLPKALQIAGKDEFTKRIIRAIIKEQQPDLPSLLQKTSSDGVKATDEKFSKLQNKDKNTAGNLNPRPQIQPLNLSDFPPLDEITLNGTMTNGGFELSIPKLALTIHKKPKENSKDSLSTITITSLATLYPYSPALQYYGFKAGSVELAEIDKNIFGMNVNLTNLEYPIYTKNGKRVDSLSVSGNLYNDVLTLATPNWNIANQKKHSSNTPLNALAGIEIIKNKGLLQFKIKDYDLNVEEMFHSNIPVLRENLENNESKTISEEKLLEERQFVLEKERYERKNGISPNIVQLEATRSNIIYDYVIPTDEITLTLRNGRIDASGKYGNGFLEAEILHGKAKIELRNFSGKFINIVMGKKLLNERGLFDLNGHIHNKVFKGNIDIRQATFMEYAFLQNFFAAIDTFPNLISFKKPGFSKDGYEIKHGKIQFFLDQDNIGFEKIDLTGSTIDIEGKGIIDLKKKTIDLRLQASTLKTLGKILSQTPLVGYIILGEDGKISTKISIKGALDEPKVVTTLAEDFFTAPFDMIGRVINIFKEVDE